MQPMIVHLSRRKRCPGCQSSRGIDKFYRNRAQTDGCGVYCKDCERARARERRIEYRVLNTLYPLPATQLHQICTCCATMKPLTEYRRQCSRRTGYATKCKQCMKVQKALSAATLQDILDDSTQHVYDPEKFDWSDWYML